jgi:hypothetical protein
MAEKKSREQLLAEREHKRWVDMEKIRVKGDEKASMTEINNMPFKDQAKVFLNAFGNTPDDYREFLFSKLYPLIVELDKKQWANAGNPMADYLETGGLSQENAMKFVEEVCKMRGDPVPQAIELKEIFRKVDSNFDGKMALIEFLIWDQGRSVPLLLAQPQLNGDFGIHNAQVAVDNVHILKKNWETEYKRLEDVIANGTRVKAMEAKNLLEKHKMTANQFEQDLAKADAGMRSAIARAAKQCKAMGSLWWTAREAAQITMDGPQKKQK